MTICGPTLCEMPGEMPGCLRGARTDRNTETASVLTGTPQRYLWRYR